MVDKPDRAPQIGPEDDVQAVINRAADGFEQEDLAEIRIYARECQHALTNRECTGGIQAAG